MATKAKIRKKKKDAPAPSVSNVVDNKDLENTDKSEKDPVLVKTAPVSNILDTVSQESIKDEEEEIKIVNDVNKNDDPQKKKDGVYEKRDQEKELRSRSPSQLSVVSASRRSPSPFKSNVVEPAPDDGTNLGSSVSLRSNISAKEAWSDTGSISKNDTKKSKSKVSTTPVTTIDSNKNKKPDDTVSLVSRATLNAEQNQNAYIPYVHARNCIKQMTRDMENMKISHVRIVHDIEKNYRAIEDEAQNQFNMFILSLKQQYNGKVKTFKQVVEVHRVDLESKETYWQNVFKSLTDRNNKILREKKAFLIKHKLEIERLTKEKETLKTELTSMVDKANSESKQVEKDYAEKIEKESTSYKNLILQLEEEKKILQDELERERREKDRLNTMILEGQSGSAVPFIDVITADTSKEEGESEMVMPVLTVAAGREEKEQMEDEREQMSKERLDLLEERQHIDEERKRFSEERKVFVNEMSRVQEEINQSRKDSAEWEAKYNSLKTDFSNSLTLQMKYKALENQYMALSAIVASDTASSTKAAIENEEKSKSEKDMMENEKKRLQNEIAEWEKEFQKKNNRSPEEEDKSDSAKELYTTLEEVNTMVESLDKKIETFHKVQSGNVPDVPEVSAVPFVVKDPEIRTVEVTVPDPAILVTLAKCQEEVEQLKSQLSESQREKSDLNSTLSEVNSELLSSKTKITELQTKLALEKDDITTQESVSAVPVISSASTEEIEELKRKLAEKEKELEKLKLENGEMLKDMKKMVKRYNKLDEKLKASSAAAKDSQLLHVVASLVKDIHSEVPAASEKVNQRVADVTADENIKEDDKELQLQALQIVQNGVFVGEDKKETQSDNKELENKITELEERIIDLESDNDVLKKEREENLEKVEEAESELTNLKNQVQISTVAKTSEDDELQKQVLELQAEKSSHDKTKTELDNVQTQLQEIQEDLTNKKVELETELETIKKKLNAEIKAKEAELTKLNARNDELEKERLSNVPLDSANEIKALQKRISVLEKEKKELDSVKVGSDSKVDELQSKLDQALKNLNTHKASNKELETKIKAVRSEKEKAVKDLTSQLEKKDQEKLVLERKKTFVGKGAAEKGGTDAAAKALKEQLQAAKRENIELNNRIKQLEKELSKSSKSDADAIAMDKLTKRHEKILKELEKKYEMEKSKNERNVENIKEKDEEIKSLTKDCNNKNIEIKKLEAELDTLGEAAKEGVEAAVKVKALEADNKNLIGENKILSENFNSERILRKKYYNMVEDMKGKIRVYCRARPLSTSEKERGNVSVINSPDEYSLHITTTRGLKEFQYDQVFMEGSSQEQVFADTNNLIQSAVDGYNVCMFAYGQTGSGKTFTMIGDREQKFPGIAPRAFQRIFELAEENKSKFNMKVSTYMLELYNDKLIDLFAAGSSYDEDRLDIKKDKKGMVVVQGSVVKEATNGKELFALFEEGSKNRHVASTKMNAESSRSHLIVGIVMESTNKVTGQILKGKLSLVDLAGSERVGKTGATAEQLKEAMSINKSLSALGDVISALSSEQSFIPYRNNKLTMLMQDSLGGNAKTLMFVNISPADYNQDESVISLTYASRVKLITNDASKNADNKEIARLKNIIQKLKQGEAVDEED